MNTVKKPASYDAIIIGSGMTGGWAAKELTEKGLKVLVLEAGRPTVPEEDYVEHVPVYEKKFRGLTDRNEQMKTQAVQRMCYACDEWAQKFFVNDLENPVQLPIPENRSHGFAGGKSAGSPSCGPGSPTAGATWILRRI